MTPAHVIGAALTPFNRRRDGSHWRDWAAQAFADALAQATIAPRDITALIVASESDYFTGQLNPSAVLASDLGLVGAAAWRVEGGGASGQLAVHAGVQAVAARGHRHIAVVGVDPSASGLPADQTRRLYGHSFDALHEGPMGITATALYALSWQIFAARHGLGDGDLATVTIQNRSNACANPRAHLPRHHSLDDIAESPMIANPYRRLHCSPLSDGAAAVILSAPTAVPLARQSAPRIVGIGAATDHVHLAARPDPGAFAAKTAAMKRAATLAEMNPEDVDIAEVYDAYAGAQLQALSALGLTHRGLSVNLSGGLMGQGAPVGATGVGQVATLALMLEGVYDGQCPAQTPHMGLADTHGGVATTCAVTLLRAA